MSGRPGYIIGDHWLEVAFGRICAGDQEQAVMADYGWVQLTPQEREAVESALWDLEQNPSDESCAQSAATLRGLLERTK